MKRFFINMYLKIGNKNVYIAILFLLSFIFLFVLRTNYNFYHYSEYHADEYHTIHQGLNLLVNGKVENFRVQEGSRWLARLFYPVALIKMNTMMGGNVFIDDWGYPGHNYVVRNFVNNYDNFIKQKVVDINLRDLFFNLRQLYILFVYLTFLPLIYYFFKKGYYLFPFGLVVLLGINMDLVREQSIFYVEPALLAILNLIIFTFVYLLERRVISWSVIFIYSFLLAFAVATKFTAAPFILLPIFQILLFENTLKKKIFQIISFCIGGVVFYLVINFPAFVSLENLNIFLHDFSSNFWQYSAGSNVEYTVASGAAQLSLVLHQLEGLFGYLLYLLPIIIIFGVYFANRQERFILLPFLFLSLLVVYTFIGQVIFLTRNLIPFYSIFLLVSLLSLEILFRQIKCKRRTSMVFLLLAIIGAVGLVNHNGGLKNYYQNLLPVAKVGFFSKVIDASSVQEHNKIYAIGFDDIFFNFTSFKENIIRVNDAPASLNNANYEEYEQQFGRLSKESVVLVNRVGNNKHLTNYILPKYFKENDQLGNYYLFYNNYSL